ncbi:hypothetical protein [Parasporobacterium paucivorans]|uniref:Uncharacterized protein n=1 Tax=Parasporobacterium paucivorans DSM 15970 TaxID=1122934 RepID=A0A1M6F371_9FIRM|nr:hypothetical protein [Parasporobacterium paucivorans]SHI92123.1 hypothetical protein SAMN02745691_01038 [Parasporobacterium paucivorans DSM 15970]
MKKELVFNMDKASNAEVYVKRLEKIIETKKAYDDKRDIVHRRIEELSFNLEQVQYQIMMELDPEATKELTLKADAIEKEIKLERSIDNTNLKGIIKASLDDVNASPEALEAGKEYTNYQRMLHDEIKAIEKDAEDRVQELRQELNRHPYSQATRLKMVAKSYTY